MGRSQSNGDSLPHASGKFMSLGLHDSPGIREKHLSQEGLRLFDPGLFPYPVKVASCRMGWTEGCQGILKDHTYPVAPNPLPLSFG
jgi:hypothetical protein